MSVVTFEGTQIIPDVRDVKAKIAPWVVAQCFSADQRRKHPEWAEIAGQLVIL